MLNKDLDQYFQNVWPIVVWFDPQDPAVAKQNLDNQLDEYYRQNNVPSIPLSLDSGWLCYPE